MSRLAFSCLLLAVLVGVMGQNVEGEMARSFSATAGVKSAVSVEMTIITSIPLSIESQQLTIMDVDEEDIVVSSNTQTSSREPRPTSSVPTATATPTTTSSSVSATATSTSETPSSTTPSSTPTSQRPTRTADDIPSSTSTPKPSPPKESPGQNRLPVWIGLSVGAALVLALFLFWRYRINAARKKQRKERESSTAGRRAVNPHTNIIQPVATPMYATGYQQQHPGMVIMHQAADPGYVKYSSTAPGLESSAVAHYPEDAVVHQGQGETVGYIKYSRSVPTDDQYMEYSTPQQYEYPAAMYEEARVCGSCGYYEAHCQCANDATSKAPEVRSE
ncbi:MAG: hypothetical protein SGCHY_001598 [Lobulomycetales sp.]